MRPQLHSPPMPARRLIPSCLGAVAVAVLLLGCGSGKDVTGADIDPLIASDLNGQLDRIEAFFNQGNCDRASKAVANLKVATDEVESQTGELFTKNMNEIADNLEQKVEQECVQAEPTTTTDTTDTQPTTTDTEPTTTDTQPTTTDTQPTTTDTQPTTTNPPGGGNNGGNGNNGGPSSPGGGVTPGKRGVNR
jgi:hypothetical protein